MVLTRPKRQSRCPVARCREGGDSPVVTLQPNIKENALKHKDMKMPFGLHKGVLIADLPDSYLAWLREQDWFWKKFPEHVEQVKIEQKYRKDHDITIKEVYNEKK